MWYKYISRKQVSFFGRHFFNKNQNLWKKTYLGWKVKYANIGSNKSNIHLKSREYIRKTKHFFFGCLPFFFLVKTPLWKKGEPLSWWKSSLEQFVNVIFGVWVMEFCKDFSIISNWIFNTLKYNFLSAKYPFPKNSIVRIIKIWFDKKNISI